MTLLYSLLPAAPALATTTTPGLFKPGSNLVFNATTGAYDVDARTPVAATGAVPAGEIFVCGTGAYTYTIEAIAAKVTGSSVIVVAASGATQTLAFPSFGNAIYDLTLTANCTLTLTGGAAGQAQTITLFVRQDATAGRVLTLPAGVKWPNGTAPTPNTASGGVDVFTFTTPDARATVIGGY